LKDKKNEVYKSIKDSPFRFNPKNITIKDDAFHGSNDPRFTEWWYFDAVFDNGYSAQLSVRVLSIVKNRFVPIIQRLDIYKDGALLQHNKIRHSLKKSEMSKEKPIIKLSGEQVIKGEINKNGNMEYHLTFNINNTSADLIFEGCTKGWKGTNPGGDFWAVVLPRAKVKGVLKIDDKEIKVKGTGYHDHNWDVKYKVTRKNLGWFWGKINTENFTITWATIFKNKNIGQPLLVINENDKGYINFKPEEIKFIGDKLGLENGKKIPHHFLLEADNGDSKLNFLMDTKDLHHVRVMLTYHYWRYHLKCIGKIIVDNKSEEVNDMQIAEFLRFKDQ
jgi:predicted secreted hydrolase